MISNKGNKLPLIFLLMRFGKCKILNISFYNKLNYRIKKGDNIMPIFKKEGNQLVEYTTQPSQIADKVDTLERNTCVNLLNPTAQTQTINGVTFTNNGDGTYTVNGTASAWTFLNINYIDSSTLSVPVGTYKLTGTPPNNRGVRIQVMMPTSK